MKVKIFYTGEGVIEDIINEWFSEHKDTEIFDIMISSVMYGRAVYVFYEEGKKDGIGFN